MCKRLYRQVYSDSANKSYIDCCNSCTSIKIFLIFQLENGHSLFDYNVGLNAIVQVMFRAEGTLTQEEQNGDDLEGKTEPMHNSSKEVNGINEVRELHCFMVVNCNNIYYTA